jgi:hypothetical protein
MNVQAVLRVRTTTLGPKAAESTLLDYKGVQRGFEELWVIRDGIGRGIRDSSAAWLGVYRGPARARRS